MRTIVHVSGYSLAADPCLSGVTTKDGRLAEWPHKDWEHVCWGIPARGVLGRIPMGLWAAHRFRADSLVWSSGSTSHDGRMEADVMRQRAFDSFDDLVRSFPHRFNGAWSNVEEFRTWLARISVIETNSVNTETSMTPVREYLSARHGLATMLLYVVTSANHLPRVLKHTMQAFSIGNEAYGYHPEVTVIGIPAETCYGGRHVTDMSIRDLGT